MPYATLPKGADLVKARSQGFFILDVSDDIDLGYFYYKCSGNTDNKLRVYIKFGPEDDPIEKLSEDGDVLLVNTSPPTIKVLVLPADLIVTGTIQFLVEVKIDDSWLQSDAIDIIVKDDPAPVVGNK